MAWKKYRFGTRFYDAVFAAYALSVMGNHIKAVTGTLK